MALSYHHSPDARKSIDPIGRSLARDRSAPFAERRNPFILAMSRAGLFLP
jgi:hypothetical protein